MNYKTDFFLWTQEQAALLKAGNFNALDIDNLVDEVESIGTREHDALEGMLRRLMMYLLKLNLQPEYEHTQEWKLSIYYARAAIETLLESSPSLSKSMPDMMAYAYKGAALDAEAESGHIVPPPRECPWTLEQILNEDWLP